MPKERNCASTNVKEIPGYGTNRAVSVLDYLDSIGFTYHVGD